MCVCSAGGLCIRCGYSHIRVYILSIPIFSCTFEWTRNIWKSTQSRESWMRNSKKHDDFPREPSSICWCPGPGSKSPTQKQVEFCFLKKGWWCCGFYPESMQWKSVHQGRAKSRIAFRFERYTVQFHTQTQQPPSLPRCLNFKMIKLEFPLFSGGEATVVFCCW